MGMSSKVWARAAAAGVHDTRIFHICVSTCTWKCVMDSASTPKKFCLAKIKGVACRYNKKVRGCGNEFPPRFCRSCKMGSVSPQMLILRAVRHTVLTLSTTSSVGKGL